MSKHKHMSATDVAEAIKRSFVKINVSDELDTLNSKIDDIEKKNEDMSKTITEMIKIVTINVSTTDNQNVSPYYAYGSIAYNAPSGMSVASMRPYPISGTGLSTNICDVNFSGNGQIHVYSIRPTTVQIAITLVKLQ